jgi:hypothetical protein
MTYDELKAAILAWTNKPEVEQELDRFIDQTEAKLQRRLRVRRMVNRASTTINSEYETVPTDFAGLRSFQVDGSPSYALEVVAPDQLTALKPSYQTAGKPRYVAIVGGEFHYLPQPPGDGYTGQIEYWRKIPALSDSNAYNWISEEHPDAYLYGCLVEAASFLGDGRISTWAVQFSAAIDEIIEADKREGYGPGLQTRSGIAV